LPNKSSTKYNNLKVNVIKAFDDTYAGDDQSSLAYNAVEIKGFRKGSIIVDFIISFIYDLAQGANVTDKLTQSIKAGQLGNFLVDKDYLVLTKVDNNSGKTSKRKVEKEDTLSTGAKVAIGICSVIVVAGIVLAAVYVFWRRSTGKVLFQHTNLDNPIYYSSKAQDVEQVPKK